MMIAYFGIALLGAFSIGLAIGLDKSDSKR